MSNKRESSSLGGRSWGPGVRSSTLLGVALCSCSLSAGWSGNLVLNGGATYAQNTTGKATISASSDAGQPVKMCFSWNGSTFTGWESYASSRVVSLPAGDGSKTLCVKFQDASGAVSPVYQDSIVLDATLPTGSVFINAGATRTLSSVAVLTLAAVDALSGPALMQFSKDGTNWTTWEAYATTRTVSLLPGSGPRFIQVRFKDAAGNVSLPASASIDVVTCSGSVSLNGGVVSANARAALATLTGAIGGLPPTQMQFSWDGSNYTAWEAYKTSRAVTLPAGDGLKTLSARFRDGDGNLTPAYQASLQLDMTPPTGSVVIDGGAAQVAPGVPLALTLVASDSRGVTQMQFSRDGSSWTPWEAFASSRVLDPGLLPGSGLRSIYARFRDAAGNVSGTCSDDILVLAVDSLEFLKVRGNQLCKASGAGDPVYLHGTNLGGWLLQEAWMTPLSSTDEWTLRQTLANRFGAAAGDALIASFRDTWIQGSDLDNIKAMGMNVVRLPLFYLDLMDLGGNWKPNPWTRIDWLVDQCRSRGIYVLLDLHGTFGGQNKFDNCGQANSAPQLWPVAQNQDYTVKLWQGLAEHYRGNPAVAGYDLLNEPDVVSAAQLNGFYDRLYRAIRAIDADHTIFLEAAWDWNQLSAPTVFGWSNVVYELHYYAMSGNQAQSWDSQNGFIDGVLQGIRDHQGYNVPIYAGEFCVFAFDDLWGKLLAGFNQLGVHYTNWTYKVDGGGNWGFYNNASGTWPNPAGDAFTAIQADWQGFDTATHFQPNTAFQNNVKPYFAGKQLAPMPSYWALKASINGKFACALNEGRDALAAVSATPGTWEWFQILENGDGTLSLRAKISAGYLSADLTNGAKLFANRGAIGTWEKFRRVDMGNGEWALQALANNLYVSVDAGTGAMVASAVAPGGSAAFTFTQAVYGLKSLASGSFVSADLNLGGQLVANRATAGGWEAFAVVPNANGSVSLLASANGKYVSVLGASGATVMASASSIGPAEQFSLVDLGGGTCALRCQASGQYVMANLSNGGNLVATSPSPGDWEKFQFSAM